MRARLTLSYAAFVVVVGVAFVVVGLLVLRFVPDGNIAIVGGGYVPDRSDLLAVFVKYTSWALPALAAVGLGGGWIVAGRMLKPLTRITAAARLARDGSLDHRIRMPGRDNELAELADTFDDMLSRMQLSVDEQRRFSANASHELRTPHAVIRTMLEVAQLDPEGRDVDVLLSRIAEMNERSITLTEALLSLADADRYDEPLTVLDVGELASDVVDELAAVAAQAYVRIKAHIVAVQVRGNATLLRQLIVNLVQNAVVHNYTNGDVIVSTGHTAEGGVVLDVSNTGEQLDEATLATFTEPFTRGAGRTRRSNEHYVGSGLGLALVASIVRVHSATLVLTPRPGGGLHARVMFPPTPVDR